jgi:hypothetical protein
MDPAPFFYIHITVYFLQALFTFLQSNIFYHTIRLILCYSKPVRLTTSLQVGAKYFGCVVYRFHVAAGAELRLDRCHKQIVWSVAKSGSINLRKWFLSPTGSIKPWFHTEGNLPLCSSYLPLGVPNWMASTANQAFFWRRCRGERGFLQGESLASNLLLCYYFSYFLYFIFACIFL